MFSAQDFFSFPSSLPFGDTFIPGLAPWEWVPLIRKALTDASGFRSDCEIPAGFSIEGEVYIHPSVKLPAFGLIQGPAYIGEGTELRPGVYIRGNVIAGANCVLGNSCEFKNSLLLDRVQVPHFSYVGDSILGNGAHLGAGVICSNLRLDQQPVKVELPEGGLADSGLRKLGALIGDEAEVGCNTVLNPGSLLGRRALVMPSMSFRGTVAENMIAFTKQKIERVSRVD